jgi:hypothetical protein
VIQSQNSYLPARIVGSENVSKISHILCVGPEGGSAEYRYVPTRLVSWLVSNLATTL